jgi:predicted TIM-barrel fold metal-dependent hydrolase
MPRIFRWSCVPPWGYTVETATQAIRLVLGGVFDAYPRPKVVLGHLGETLPFLVWREAAAKDSLTIFALD